MIRHLQPKQGRRNEEKGVEEKKRGDEKGRGDEGVRKGERDKCKKTQVRDLYFW